MAKKVNVILKYFQNKNFTNDNKFKDESRTTKSYAQVSKPPVNTAEVLKIKKVFLALNAEKLIKLITSSKELLSQSLGFK